MTTSSGGEAVLAPAPTTALGVLAPAGLASLGAGAVHGAAIGIHAEHRQAALAFTALAALQLGWGALALVGRRRAVALVGAAVNVAAVAGWVMAKTSGISFVDGLEEAEGVQWPDALAAGLAAFAVVAALRVAVAGARLARPPRPALGAVAAVVAAASLVGMTQASSHSHEGGHGGEAAHGAGHADDHGGTEDHGDDHATGAGDHGSGHEASVVAPKPYVPDEPIDLSGVEGVSPQQQARAENLIAITLARLPRYADHRVAEADDFHSIGDGLTGYEHFINWNYINDEHVLDPDFPEALVYRRENGERKLVSAMFMLSEGKRLDDIPDVGGPLTQWHVHEDLCFTDDPVAPQVAGVTGVGGPCNPPLVRHDPVPMLHVWIVPHPCGPFAALEGVGAGQIAEGEDRLCDHAHGT